MSARVANRDALTALIEARLRALSNDAVLTRLRDGQVPCAPVLDIAGVTADAHVAARGTLMASADPTIGDILQTRMPIGAGAPPTPAPVLGQHSRAVLHDLGFDDDTIDALIATDVITVPEDA